MVKKYRLNYNVQTIFLYIVLLIIDIMETFLLLIIVISIDKKKLKSYNIIG